MIREEKEQKLLLPLVFLPGWVASRVIKLPPARACLQLAPQHHASHTSKLPRTYQQPRPSGKLSKADKPQDSPLDTLPPSGVCCLVEKKHRRVPAGTRQQEKALSVNSKQFGIHHSSPQTSTIWGRKFTRFYNIFLEADCHHHPNDREAVNTGPGATDGKSPGLLIYPLGSGWVMQASHIAVPPVSSHSGRTLSP